MKITIWVFASIILLAAVPGYCGVTSSGPSGFEIRNETVIAAAPDEIYTALTRRVGSWWDADHTYSGDARNMRIDARPGGCFCEKIPGKGAIEHMRVIYVSKDEVLRLSGGLGPLQESGVAGTLTWSLKSAEQGTIIVQEYKVGGYLTGGFSEMAPLVGQVLEVQMQRLKRFVETGSPEENTQ